MAGPGASGRCHAGGEAGDNLLPNAELTGGSGAAPAYWRHHSIYDAFPSDIVSFSWFHPPGASGELRITGQTSDLARWMQTVSLNPGWYLLSAELRTEDLDPNTIAAAQIGIDQGDRLWTVETDPRQRAKWTSAGVYFKVASSYRQVRIDCAIQSPGKAFFRSLRLARLEGPPSPDSTQFDLDLLPCEPLRWHERHSANEFRRSMQARAAEVRAAGQPLVLRLWAPEAIMLLMAAIAVAGWLGLGRIRRE